MAKKKNHKKIGLITKGKNFRGINNFFSSDLDIAMQDEGESTFTKGNKFGNNNENVKERWYQKWWIKYLIFPVVVGLIIWFLTK